MTPTFRRLCLGAALLIAVLGTGCGKKSTKPNPIPALTQAQSDDLVQQVGMAASIDHGGWLVDVLSTLESIPRGNSTQPAMNRRVLRLPASARPGVFAERDTLFTRASMNYQISYFYTSSNGDSLGAWADSVTQVDAASHATGTLTDAAPVFSSFYRHDGDPVTAIGFADTVGPDTISFTGVGDDSLLASFTPAIRGGATVFYATTGFTDFDITMLRNTATNAFPIAGTANVFLFADQLKSANPNDPSGTTLEATVTFTFNGTQSVTVGVTNELESTTPQFRYTLDLRTGHVTRLP